MLRVGFLVASLSLVSLSCGTNTGDGGADKVTRASQLQVLDDPEFAECPVAVGSFTQAGNPDVGETVTSSGSITPVTTSEEVAVNRFLEDHLPKFPVEFPNAPDEYEFFLGQGTEGRTILMTDESGMAELNLLRSPGMGWYVDSYVACQSVLDSFAEQ